MSATTHQIRFARIHDAGRGCTFPCDKDGQVNLDSLSDGEREMYLYARHMVGREYMTPTIEVRA